jgi:serine/threonine protein kinase
MELTVQNVYGLLMRSKLLSVDEAKAMFARWQAESKENYGNLARFAAWMVANRYVTVYQASLLARGHADGFFLNEYKILDRLGKGRMAGVYKAMHRLGQIVAIKVLPPSKASDASLLARFQREARLAQRLNHANIVRTFQMGLMRGLHYLVMEYLEGETLEDVLARRSKLPPGEAVRLVYQALLGLQHIHALGMVHRDLKPANLMLLGGSSENTLRSTVKLLDIGLGRDLFEERAEHPSDPGVTSEGVLLGTPDYMAPEQGRDPRTADVRCDIYSLGCVLYHALAGQPPFPDTNIISQMIRHATEPARPLKEFNSAVPDGLQQIVNRLMAKDPGSRYPTPEQAAQALQGFLAAGAEPARSDADPKMRSYLTWLEVEDKKRVPETVTPAKAKGKQNVPVAMPVQPAKASQPAPLAQPVGKHTHHHGKKRSRKGRHAAPAPPAPKAVAPDINVELVPFLPPPAPPELTGARLTRRDFIVFGIGAGAGALATFLGCLFALSRRRE